ncbi:MAG: glycosyltransferase family 2 protein [Austwickia sp.]|nr:glycosyltransferase family 2 protein [Austwickia sp.]
MSQAAQALSVVVCAYTDERWDDLLACVSSLIEQQDPVGEIVVVIDHNPQLLHICRRQWPDLRVVPNAGAKGLSGARNTGWRLCSGPLVAFIDDDACADAAWSRELAGAYADDVLGVGGYIDPIWPDGGQPSWWPSAFNWVVGCSYTGMPRQRSRVRNAIGANMSVRKHVLEDVEGFATSLGRVGKVPLGAEETAMYLKAGTLHQGMSVLYEPAARVHHRVTSERVTADYFVKRCFGEGRSKARMARMNLAPQSQALHTERTYVVRTLPIAVVQGLFSSDPRRGLAVILGLLCTAAGYLQEVVTHATSR